MENETGLERIAEWEDTHGHMRPINSPAEGYIVVQAKTGGIVLPADHWSFENWPGNQDGAWTPPETPRMDNNAWKGEIYAVREDWLNEYEERA